MKSEGKAEPPAPNRAAISAHLQLLHIQAKATGAEGVLVLVGYGDNPTTGEKIPSRVQAFAIGDITGMVDLAVAWTVEQHRNVYLAPVIMRHGLSVGSRGGTKDIVRVFGLVADYDDEDAAKWPTRVPITPSLVIESSPGRFQTPFYLDPALDPAQAEALAKRLQATADCDHGTGDIAHVWRIDGTLNWPNKKKVDAGRSREPVLVVTVPGGTGDVVKVQELETRLGPGTSKNKGKEKKADRITADDETQLKRMFASKNGDKIKALWDGDYSAYPSHSEADSALCFHLAYWFVRGPVRMDRMFRQSKLMRQKWDERHGATTYGARVIANACAKVTHTYQEPSDLAERLARLRALSPAELSATWHTYHDGLNAVDRQILLKEVARLMNVGINTLKKAASEHQDKAHQAKINERVGPRLLIPFHPEDVTVMATVAERATLALTNDFELINYGGVLSRVVVEPIPLAHQADSDLPAVPTAQLDMLNRVKFLPLVERAVVVQADGENIGVPDKILDHILQNPSQVPKVSALITHPLVTLKGRIVSDCGIDSATGLLLYGDRVNDLRPYAKVEAMAAVVEVGTLVLDGFEFPTPFDRACAIGMMLTALQRRAMDMCPGFLVSAAQQGTGKTTLAKRIHHVLTGREMPVFSWPGEKDETETIKLLLATLLLSPAMICFDNVGDALTFRSSAISAVMTGASLSGRILGESRNATVSTNTLFVLTGNNVELGADELQRWIRVWLTSRSISPHTRQFAHPDVLGYSLQIRERVLRHCVGIVAGYLQGADTIAPSSRFPQWDTMVRQPLLWAGLYDLGKAFDLNIEASPELGAHQALVLALVAAFPNGRKFNAHDVIEVYGFATSLHPLKEALLALHSKDPNSDLSVGHVLAKAVGRAVMSGECTAFLRKQSVHGLTRYHVDVQKRVG